MQVCIHSVHHMFMSVCLYMNIFIAHVVYVHVVVLTQQKEIGGVHYLEQKS